MDKPKAISLVMTCSACPAQWEGNMEDGRTFYVRYRWGHLSLRVSPSATDDVSAAIMGEEIFSQDHGESFDGFLSADEMKELTKDHVDWSMV